MREECIDEVWIESNSGRVYGVITSAERNDACPCDRETVGLNTVFGKHSNVLLPQSVWVRSDIAVFTIQSLVGHLRKIIPDRPSPSIYRGRALNLEGSYNESWTYDGNEAAKAVIYLPVAKPQRKSAENFLVVVGAAIEKVIGGKQEISFPFKSGWPTANNEFLEMQSEVYPPPSISRFCQEAGFQYINHIHTYSYILSKCLTVTSGNLICGEKCKSRSHARNVTIKNRGATLHAAQ